MRKKKTQQGRAENVTHAKDNKLVAQARRPGRLEKFARPSCHILKNRNYPI